MGEDPDDSPTDGTPPPTEGSAGDGADPDDFDALLQELANPKPKPATAVTPAAPQDSPTDPTSDAAGAPRPRSGPPRPILESVASEPLAPLEAPPPMLDLGIATTHPSTTAPVAADDTAPAETAPPPTKLPTAGGEALSPELEALLKEARVGAPQGRGEVGQTLSLAENLVGEVLGEDRYVGEESLCPACGALTSVYADHCQSCGVQFDNDVCQCGNCGEWVPAEALFCGKCTQPLVSQEALCPKCFGPVPFRADSCPNCHVELVQGDMRCAKCHGHIEGSSVTCTSCGTLLVEGAARRSDLVSSGVIGGGGGPGGGGGGVAGVQVQELKAAVSQDGVTELEVENRIDNQLQVEANVKMPEGGIMSPGAIAAQVLEAQGAKSQATDKAREEQRKDARAKLQKAKGRRIESLFPFSAILGQEKMKTALLVNVIDPLVGGVLITGQKGTGKSVTIRGLIEVTPQIKFNEDCRFACDPARPGDWCWECRERFEGRSPESVPTVSRPLKVVDLPLNATEDRVVGTLDVGRMLTEGVVAFEHGVLADANRGVLYVDEINLLDDYVVDVLLDAAAMGRVSVEREGVSVSYPARFVLAGSMNPEEGSLRPQLLDRIALQVSVTGIEDVNSRQEIVRRREAFDRDPRAFRAKFEPEQEKIRAKVTKARDILPKVEVPANLFAAIPKVTTTFGVDGHRADIMIERGSKALAAFDGRYEVTSHDLGAIAEMVLPHRMRRKPFEQAEFSADRLRRVIEENT